MDVSKDVTTITAAFVDLPDSVIVTVASYVAGDTTPLPCQDDDEPLLPPTTPSFRHPAAIRTTFRSGNNWYYTSGPTSSFVHMMAHPPAAHAEPTAPDRQDNLHGGPMGGRQQRAEASVANLGKEQIPAGITPSMVTRVGRGQWDSPRLDDYGEVIRFQNRAAAPKFISRRRTRGAADLMSMRRSCRRLFDLMGTLPFWIEMCRHRYGYFEVPDEMTPEQIAALEEEKAVAREKAAVELKAVEEEKERRKRLRDRAKRRAEKLELKKGSAATEMAQDIYGSATSGDQQSAQNVSSSSTMDPEDEDTTVSSNEVSLPSKLEAVVAYSHSRIVLPSGRNDASWWEKIFFDVSHTGCDHCNAFPMDVFFKCLHCNDVYLCENCELHHPRTHLMAKVSTPFRWTQPNLVLAPNHVVHSGYCSFCYIPFGEVLYQCTQCWLEGGDYKICPACRKGGPLDHEHSKFWEVIIPENDLYDSASIGKNPRYAGCDGEGSKCTGNCTGINWKCLVCEDYDLCEVCEKNREFSCLSNHQKRNNTHDLTHPMLKVLDSKFNEYKWVLSCPTNHF
ncbi:hypothetical protein Pelo_1040 [Pelomyxa schiedti]|nr:hypothetical protein Pelo_1040 [Pelomyxa schiedti]